MTKKLIDFVFVDDISPPEKIDYSYPIELKVNESTTIKINDGQINGQHILFEEIINKKLRLHEKNYLTLCRYFDCKHVMSNKFLLSIMIRTISFVNVKIACTQENMELHIYYPKIKNSGNQTNVKSDKAKTLLNEFPETLLNLFFKYGITLNFFNCDNFYDKLCNYQVIEGSMKIFNLTFIPFFDNVKYTEDDVNAVTNHARFKEYLNTILGSYMILQKTNISKIEENISYKNDSTDNKYKLANKVDIQFFKVLNYFEKKKIYNN